MDKWKGKLAVVTGASAGIGAGITLALAREGLHVIGIARRLEKIEELAANISFSEGKITARKCDVSDVNEIKSTFKWIEKTFGKIDILVNNAGIFRLANVLTQEDNLKDILDTIDINLTVVVVCIKEAYKLMAKSGGFAYIININSIAGHIGSFGPNELLNVYPGTKFAVRVITDVIRHELIALKNDKIRITNVSPGEVRTEIVTSLGLPEEFYQMRPYIDVEDIVDSVLHILKSKPHVHIRIRNVWNNFVTFMKLGL